MKIFCVIWLVCMAVLQAGGLEFERDTLDVKVGSNEQSVQVQYEFTNRSSKALTIRDADAGCSCLAVEVAGGKLEYAPGESGVLRATFQVGSFQGLVDKPIYLWLKGDPDEKPSTTLHLRVHVPVIISLEPKTLKWEVGEVPVSKLMEVRMDYERPIHVESATTSQEKNFSVRLITVEEGKHYQVEVTPRDLSSPALAIIRVVTDADVKKQRVQQGFATVSLKKK